MVDEIDLFLRNVRQDEAFLNDIASYYSSEQQPDISSLCAELRSFLKQFTSKKVDLMHALRFIRNYYF